MRPRDPNLRLSYEKVAEDTRRRNVRLSKELLAQRLQLKKESVRMFLYRNPLFARRIGLSPEQEKHSQNEYLEAIGLVARRGKVTNTSLARQLGLRQSSVSKYLSRHPEVRAAMIAMNMFLNAPPDT